MKTQEVRATRPDLAALLAKWQPILRLQDWDIEIIYVQAFELDQYTGGKVIRCDAKKTARIKVLELDCHDPCLIVKNDTEYTVVHELLHLHFAVIDNFKEGAETALYEQAVHRIAMALLELSR